jgi:phosphohistidine swiveling domain-containing protein
MTKEAIERKKYELFSSVFKSAKEEINKVLLFSRNLSKAKELDAARVKQLFDMVHSMEFPWVIMIPMGEELEVIIRQKLEECNLPENFLQSFFALKKDTLLIKQKKDLLKIKKELEIAGIIGKIKSLSANEALNFIRKEDLGLYKKIRQHVKKFQWFGMMHFWGSPFDEEKFINQIRGSDFKEGKNSVDIKLNKELEIIKKWTQELSYWRNHIAEVCGVASHAAVSQFKLAAEKLQIDYSQIRWMSSIELFNALKGKGVPAESILSEREKAFGIIVENGKNIIITGKKLNGVVEHLLGKTEVIKEFEGLIANRGRVNGVARVILSPEELSKIKKGDILVVPETTPDFVPSLYFAKGIIADMGGITSHAAVISRELNIPCVVGTKIATRVLKDGDLVEVDAEKGIVRILGK